jgi:hypothetical protein
VDQGRILEHNSPLYIQLKLGSFLAENHIKEELVADPELSPVQGSILQKTLFRPKTFSDKFS